MTDLRPLPPTIVFLDVDGVLQPCSSDERFRHDLDALQRTLVNEVDPAYAALNKYDIAAVRVLRRARRCSAGALLGLLCDAVARCPNLETLTVRGLERDFT